MRVADLLLELNRTHGTSSRRAGSLVETHHAYDSVDHKTAFQPLRAGDTVRLFHGFYDPFDAVKAVKRGLSGKVKAPRVYSYEGNNNPNGLFVTLSFKVAADFVGANTVQAIMEFNAPVTDLEAPVWPGGGWTGQGQKAEYFSQGRAGRIERAKALRDAEQETSAMAASRPELAHVAQSDRKYLAARLFTDGESQALFVGDLNPNQIVAIYVRPSGARTTDSWTKLSPDEFLAQYESGIHVSDTAPHRKVFHPGDAFDPDRFVQGVADTFMRGDTTKAKGILANIWRQIMQRPANERGAEFQAKFGPYLWPNQYRAAVSWMKKNLR